jgi:hypothetical protein
MADYKKVLVLDNAFQAKLVENLLRERGIPHRVRSYYDSAYDGLYQAQKGWGHIEAPAEYEDEIKALCDALPGQVIPEDCPEGETE